jgi:hypothetical protein
MKAEFTALVQQLIAEQGRDALFNTAKCKSFLADYARGEYPNERRLLLQVVEAGIAAGIANTGDLASYKLMAARKLQDEYFLAPNVATGVVSMLAQMLRGETEQKTVCRNCGKELQSEWKTCPYCEAAVKPETAMPTADDDDEDFDDDEEDEDQVAQPQSYPVPQPTPVMTKSPPQEPQSKQPSKAKKIIAWIIFLTVCGIVSLFIVDYFNLQGWWAGGIVAGLVSIFAPIIMKTKD